MLLHEYLFFPKIKKNTQNKNIISQICDRLQSMQNNIIEKKN